MLARKLYQKNKQSIEHWLDMTCRQECHDVVAGTPRKFDPTVSLRWRRQHVMKHLMRLYHMADWRHSRCVLDAGAGFGDFSLVAGDFNFTRLDACEPAKAQYRFLTQHCPAYHTVYNLGLEDMDLSTYDTVAMIKCFDPDLVNNWHRTLTRYPNIKDVMLCVNVPGGEEILTETNPCSPWGWNRSQQATQYPWYFMDRMFRDHKFEPVRCLSLDKNHGRWRVWSHHRKRT